MRARIQHDLDARFGRLGVWLYRATKGRIVRPWGRGVLVLTTRGRRTGMARSVLLQYFPDDTDFIAPSYVRIPERATRRIPSIRLVPAA
jgi:hypothetical protein